MLFHRTNGCFSRIILYNKKMDDLSLLSLQVYHTILLSLLNTQFNVFLYIKVIRLYMLTNQKDHTHTQLQAQCYLGDIPWTLLNRPCKYTNCEQTSEVKFEEEREQQIPLNSSHLRKSHFNIYAKDQIETKSQILMGSTRRKVFTVAFNRHKGIQSIQISFHQKFFLCNK